MSVRAIPGAWISRGGLVNPGVAAGEEFNTDRIVTVRSASDFPDADGTGLRQLADFTLYWVVDVVDLGATYLRGGTGSSIVGISPGPCGLTNSRNDYLIRGSIGCRSVQLICPNGVAYYADQSATAFLGNVVVTGSSVAVEIVDCSRLVIDRFFSGGNGRSIVISGAVPSGQILGVQGGFGAQANFRGVEIEATATIGALTIKDCQWTLTDPTHAAFAFSTSATYDGETSVRVTSCNLVLSGGAMAIAAGSADKASPGFWFSENTEIVDSVAAGSMVLSGNTTVQTVITTADVFVPIGEGSASHPLFVEGNGIERFELVPDPSTTTSAQRLRYICTAPATFLVVSSVTAERVGGGSDIIRTRVVLNGTMISGSEGSAESSSFASSTTRPCITQLQPDDEIWIEIANGTDTSNFIVRSATLAASRI